MKRKISCLGVVSHVGVVLSFVIFVTFIIFIYIIVKPAVGTENKQNLLNYLKEVLIERASTELTSVSVLIDKETTQTCVQLRDFFDKTEIGNRVIVRNDTGEVFGAEILGQDLLVKGIGDEKFLKIYGSENFSTIGPKTSSCQPLSEGSGGYIFGLIRSEKNIFEKRIIQMIESYNNDYESLKEELNIAAGNEFRLGFTYANGTSISTEEKEVLVSVFVDEFQIQYISNDAVRELGSLNVGIW
jgi:hypothetical protein